MVIPFNRTDFWTAAVLLAGVVSPKWLEFRRKGFWLATRPSLLLLAFLIIQADALGTLAVKWPDCKKRRVLAITWGFLIRKGWAT